jgi:mannose-1-phosphate guanylyltransferase/phosphomannomutase
MKAVIMAGGKGTRLRPLTCHLPKPMVPLLEKPCMEYIIELLKRHGITEIAVTLQYLPQAIQNYFGDGSDFGVNLHYFEEAVPLGTAGSVKNAESFLDETFLVISGDALTDFDLSKAVAFHKEKQAIGTLVLTKVDVPLEYGVVMTQEDGRIIRFLEKPSWSEVFSDTVNTGIYVLEPEILKFFNKNQNFDFSKDLFPLVLANQLPLYGYIAEGYWSDIGNIEQYKQAQFDMLDGRVRVTLRGKQIDHKVWVGEGVNIHPDAEINGPVYIGEGSSVAEKAKLLPYSVLGRFTRVEKGAVIERSVVWDRNFIDQTVSLYGTLLCDDVQIGVGTELHEGTVVGEKCRIGQMAVIKPGVKIWPQKMVAERTIQHSSLIHEAFAFARLFSEGGIKGIPNVDLTPEKVCKISAAYGSCLKRHSTVTVGSDDHPYSRILRKTVISSLMATGVHVRDAGETLSPVVRYDARRSHSKGAIYIKKNPDSDDKRIHIQFYDADGLPIDSSWERKIENAYMLEDFSRPDPYEAGYYDPVANANILYIEEVLKRVNAERIRKRMYQVDVHCNNTHAWTIVKQLLERLGCNVHFWSSCESQAPRLTDRPDADLVVFLNEDVEALSIYSAEKGWLPQEEMLVLQLLLSAKEQARIAVPVHAPSHVQSLLEQKGAIVQAAKSSIRSLLEAGVEEPLQVFGDGLFLLVSILDELSTGQWTVPQLISSIPAFYMVSERVECPIEAKGKVMRRLMEEIKEQPVQLLDGIKVFTDDGWALILPDSEKALFKVIAQGNTPDRAGELTNFYKNKILYYQQI